MHSSLLEVLVGRCQRIDVKRDRYHFLYQRYFITESCIIEVYSTLIYSMLRNCNYIGAKGVLSRQYFSILTSRITNYIIIKCVVQMYAYAYYANAEMHC